VSMRTPPAAHIRSILLMEVASELIADRAWPAYQARLHLRKQGSTNPWLYCLYASDSPSVFDEVVNGDVHIAMLNPAEPLAMAVRGTGPFAKPLPLRTITTLPSYDHFAFAVAERTGLTSFADIREQQYPLKVSMREYPDASAYMMVDQVFRAAGFTMDDIVSWGGSVHRHPGLHVDMRTVESGEVDTHFEEAAYRWLGTALDGGMRLLALDESIVSKIEPIGLRSAYIRKDKFPQLAEDVLTLDYSGWPIFTHADAPDDFVRSFCTALEARKDRIPWERGWSLPLERMCKDGADTPLTAPLHTAAEAFWRERGYLA